MQPPTRGCTRRSVAVAVGGKLAAMRERLADSTSAQKGKMRRRSSREKQASREEAGARGGGGEEQERERQRERAVQSTHVCARGGSDGMGGG